MSSNKLQDLGAVCFVFFRVNYINGVSTFPIFIFVSQLSFCSIKCISFFIFSILVHQLYFYSIKCLNFFIFLFWYLKFIFVQLTI